MMTLFAGERMAVAAADKGENPIGSEYVFVLLATTVIVKQ